VNHLGFQVDEAAELDEIHARLAKADAGVATETNVSCCYARSDKHWVTDPAGVAWESFRSLGTVAFYDGGEPEPAKSGCCAPAASAAPKAACCG
jgi:hypothetical protein